MRVKRRGLTVLFCFDGISAGQLALQRCSIKVDKYYASEIAYRKLTPIECGRLQTFPDTYFSKSGISNTQIYKSLGNSWTVDVIVHIFNGLKRGYV